MPVRALIVLPPLASMSVWTTSWPRGSFCVTLATAVSAIADRRYGCDANASQVDPSTQTKVIQISLPAALCALMAEANVAEAGVLANARGGLPMAP